MTFIAPLFNKTARIIMSPSLALVMNNIAVREQRAIVLVEGGKFVERQIVDKDCCGIDRIVGAATQIHNLHAWDGLLQPYGARRIWVRSNQASIPRASADRNVSCRIGAYVPRNVESGLAANRAVHTIIRRWDRTFHDSDVCALVLPNHSFESCFGLFARARHDQFVVFPGEKIKHEFSDGWVAGAQHRFRVARAILKFEPNQDRTRRLTERFFDGC
jgi:hypothetical protein